MGRFCFNEQNKKKSADGIREKLDLKKTNIPQTYPEKSSNSFFKNIKPKNFIRPSPRKIDIDIEKN